jgi:hypothetical protein
MTENNGFEHEVILDNTWVFEHKGDPTQWAIRNCISFSSSSYSVATDKHHFYFYNPTDANRFSNHWQRGDKHVQIPFTVL